MNDEVLLRPTPHVDRLLILLGYLGRTAAEDEAVHHHFDQVEDFDVLWGLAHDNRVEPRVYSELRRLGLADRLPEAVHQRFADTAEKVKRANHQRLTAARGVLHGLADAGVPALLVKGVNFGHTLYGDLAYKRMNDVDLLVRRADLDTIRRVYADHGFFPIAERVGGDPDAQLKWVHHLPPYVNADFSCMLGTDWDFRPPLLNHDFHLDEVWQRKVPLEVEGAKLWTLSAEDELHHVAVHLERFRTGVRDIMDIHNVVFRRAIDWQGFTDRVEAAGSQQDVYYALRFAQAHRPHAEVERLIRRFEPHVRPHVKRVADARTRSDRVLVRICSRQLSTIEKRVSAFNATDVFREKLPLFALGWAGILWPSRADARKITATVDPGRRHRLKARIKAPLLLGEAISAELGGLLLAGLAVKSTVDLARSALPFGEKHDLEAYARSLGLDLNQLKAAQDQYQ